MGERLLYDYLSRLTTHENFAFDSIKNPLGLCLIREAINANKPREEAFLMRKPKTLENLRTVELGPLAHLVEHIVCNDGVRSSSLLRST